MLDDGRLTDSQGRTVDFKNTAKLVRITTKLLHERPARPPHVLLLPQLIKGKSLSPATGAREG